MTKSTNEKIEQVVAIKRLERATVDFYLLGTRPLVMNRPSAKAKQQLLLPSRKKNTAEKNMILKHDPLAEFRDTMYRCRNPNAPTFVHFPASAFKKALGSASLRTEGATKTEVGCLVQVLDETVYVYGKPYLYMDWVRQGGMQRTPDIRTRAMFPQWALKLTVGYIRTWMTEQDITNMVSNAGDVTGIGDGRTEKGTFNNGGWDLVDRNDERWLSIVKNGGRAVQQAAYDNPEAIDQDSEELWAWYESEIVRREAGERRNGGEAAKRAVHKKAKTKRPPSHDNGAGKAWLDEMRSDEADA